MSHLVTERFEKDRSGPGSGLIVSGLTTFDDLMSDMTG